VSSLTSLQTQEDVPSQNPGTIYFQPNLPQQIEANSITDIHEVLNEQWIADFFANDYSIAVPILQLFIQEALPELDQLETILKSHGAQELRKKVHKINPSFKMVGQTALAEALTALENACIAGEEINVLKSRIKKIQAHAKKVKPLILKQYNSISKLA
jgi:HPt (histidine-containing phosphotransfer) domain-containing protein